MECSPCGKVAGRERCHRLAGPGGAAVALAENQDSDYTANKSQGEIKDVTRGQYFFPMCSCRATLRERKDRLFAEHFYGPVKLTLFAWVA